MKNKWDELLALPAWRVAPRLLGWELVIGDIRARITETEAYHGENDLACHASKGRTQRSSVLYAKPGTLYVYLCYGMHWMLNVVCYREGFPSAVLIRSVALCAGYDEVTTRRGASDARSTNGPGKLCAALGLDGRYHGRRLGMGPRPVVLVPGAQQGARKCGPRVGVDYAGPIWSKKAWRFWEGDFPVAGPRPR